MSPSTQPPWSPMRIWTLVVAALLTLVLLAVIAASTYYTGSTGTNSYFSIFSKAAAVCWVAYIAAYVRDTSIAHQKIILERLREIETQVADYGDRREIAGQMIAAKANGRRLTPVE